MFQTDNQTQIQAQTTGIPVRKHSDVDVIIDLLRKSEKGECVDKKEILKVLSMQTYTKKVSSLVSRAIAKIRKTDYRVYVVKNDFIKCLTDEEVVLDQSDNRRINGTAKRRQTKLGTVNRNELTSNMKIEHDAQTILVMTQETLSSEGAAQMIKGKISDSSGNLPSIGQALDLFK